MIEIRTLRDTIHPKIIGWTMYTETEFCWIGDGCYQTTFLFNSDKGHLFGRKLPNNFTVV